MSRRTPDVLRRVKNDAKTLLRALKSTSPTSPEAADAATRFAQIPHRRARIGAEVLAERDTYRLTDAYQVLALEHGYEDWAEMRRALLAGASYGQPPAPFQQHAVVSLLSYLYDIPRDRLIADLPLRGGVVSLVEWPEERQRITNGLLTELRCDVTSEQVEAAETVGGLARLAEQEGFERDPHAQYQAGQDPDRVIRFIARVETTAMGADELTVTAESEEEMYRELSQYVDGAISAGTVTDEEAEELQVLLDAERFREAVDRYFEIAGDWFYPEWLFVERVP